MDLQSSSSASSHSTLLHALLQRPKRWTSEQLRALNFTQKSNATAEEIVGDVNLPSDGDEEFERLAADFTKPTKEDLLMVST
ncbi:hypothetical protein VTN77DRAFT_3930 [Rasamsonia byssochlamydoides]|uniref:uncharacterized protein n=1 Tax=Rasamsonia byssochlamydoides TaxID=89139 RepID=UPI0037427CBE